ncbi:glycosyltransferase family 2 protein [Rhodospirillum rubrum]|uniref:Glycosyl transferase, family 2 n=1 Tax=Rhodospirillum rubrum (strain ATCC 11170 / ATH 1.1.1 / DSM 467 / LMG 4362 / NCIMB 8255 / S1) TaxID=269796 RepID=Q2RNU3_RHORT|nr:glycosyltransferase family A protein [Rhodospirillum rubrum]ABC24202.1 Glycosyl transferase, family 2 [Rhodospirillum rubrum ATCC 11170]AEO49953.1 glycosyl transferase family protein [Rhodospirillum rubrum F11]MBK5955920.1 glycosyl transferase [Rhodospirillum rubrum]QXG80138.1 glycosyltransferase family 2 protein [Rhodospirillum rubrum]HAP98881.1 glycosyltransferase family 2 protein [Rhodospirillum rubrum]
MTLVSVVLPVYQGAPWIRGALDCLAAQTHRPLEILVVDDASSDGTPAVVEDWRARHPDLSVRLIVRPENGGPGVARNDALALARGAYVAFLDADDRCVPWRLARQLARLEAEPGLGSVGAWYDMVDADGTPVAARRLSVTAGEMAWAALIHPPFLLSTLMTRRALCRPGIFAPRHQGEDAPAQRRLLWQAPAAMIEEVLVTYRTDPHRPQDPRMGVAMAEDLAPLTGPLSAAEAWALHDALLAFPNRVTPAAIAAVSGLFTLLGVFRGLRPAWMTRPEYNRLFEGYLDLAAPFLAAHGESLLAPPSPQAPRVAPWMGPWEAEWRAGEARSDRPRPKEIFPPVGGDSPSKLSG